MEKQVWPWIVLLAVVILLYFVRPSSIVVSPNTEIPQISASADGQIVTDPDQVIVHIQTMTQGKVAKEAQNYNRDLSNKVKDTFLDNGLRAEDIETESYTVVPERTYIPLPKDQPEKGETYRITGYTVTHTFKITVKNLDKIGEIVDDAITAGANSVDNVEFRLSKEKEIKVKGEALAVASMKAKEKAQSIASSLGVGLGKLRSASESSYYQPYVNNYRIEAKAMMDVAAAPTPITPGKVGVQTTVNVVYDVAQ